jgi:hypothetical protein
MRARLRRLLHRKGGSLPKPPPIRPDEVRVTLSPGWNGPTMETSENFTGRGRNVWKKSPTA